MVTWSLPECYLNGIRQAAGFGSRLLLRHITPVKCTCAFTHTEVQLSAPEHDCIPWLHHDVHPSKADGPRDYIQLERYKQSFQTSILLWLALMVTGLFSFTFIWWIFSIFAFLLFHCIWARKHNFLEQCVWRNSYKRMLNWEGSLHNYCMYIKHGYEYFIFKYVCECEFQCA